MSNLRAVELPQELKELAKEYREFFVNTGGNDVIELIERKDINAFTNLPVAMLHLACYSQLLMLAQLKKSGKL